jgi:hypothetical protein
MPALVRLCILHAALGVGLAAVFVAALLALNTANLGHLVLTAEVPAVIVALLVALNGGVFAVVQVAVAMTRSDIDPPPPRGGVLIPVRVEARRG